MSESLFAGNPVDAEPRLARKAKMVIISVMHTGTHRLIMFLQHLKGHERPNIHPIDENMAKIDELITQGIPIVSPMRHPKNCWKGWVKRGRLLAGEDGAERFVQQWSNLMRLPVQIWVPIDTPDRDQRRAELDRFVGISAQDWDKVGYRMDKGVNPWVEMPEIPDLQEFAESFGYDWNSPPLIR